MKDDNDYTFVIHNEARFKSICKWLMDSGASKHLTSHRAVFNTYEVITTQNVHLDDNNVVQAIGMGFTVVKQSWNVKSTKFVPKMCLTFPNCMPICSR